MYNCANFVIIGCFSCVCFRMLVLVHVILCLLAQHTLFILLARLATHMYPYHDRACACTRACSCHPMFACSAHTVCPACAPCCAHVCLARASACACLCRPMFACLYRTLVCLFCARTLLTLFARSRSLARFVRAACRVCLFYLRALPAHHVANIVIIWLRYVLDKANI